MRLHTIKVKTEVNGIKRSFTGRIEKVLILKK